MALTADERKKLLGHGGLARAAKLAKRSRSHMTQLNQLLRRDAKGERAIARVIIDQHPEIDPANIWPPVGANRSAALPALASDGEAA